MHRAALTAEADERAPGSGRFVPTLFWGLCAYFVLTATFFLSLGLLKQFGGEGGPRAAILPPAGEAGPSGVPVLEARALALSFWIAAPLLLSLARRSVPDAGRWKEYLGFRAAPLSSGWVCVGFMCAAIVLSVVLDALFDRPPVDDFVKALNAAARGLWLLPVAGSIVLAGPLCEELIYRGILFSGWARTAFGPVVAGVFIAGLFALSHQQYDGSQLFEVFALGLVLCRLRWVYDSLWPPLFLHVTYNAMALVLAETFA